jgi:hypothetical protein
MFFHNYLYIKELFYTFAPISERVRGQKVPLFIVKSQKYDFKRACKTNS